MRETICVANLKFFLILCKHAAACPLAVHINEKLENQEKGLDGLDISLENSISGTLKSFSGFAYKNCSERLEKNKKEPMLTTT